MALKLVNKTVTVTTAGTRVAMFSTTTYAVAFNVSNKAANTGNGYVGDVTVTASGATQGIIVSSARDVSVEAPVIRGNQEEFDLSQQYIDADTSGNAYTVSYFVRI